MTYYRILDACVDNLLLWCI